MPEKRTREHHSELYLLRREYEAAMQVTSNPEEKWRLYRTVQELRACMSQIENY